jgi:hypothetical protein
MLSNLPNRTLIGGRWETVNLLGEGACAQVYNVRATQGNIGYELVAKVVPFAKGKNKQQERICNTLNYEYVMYNGLMSGFPHRPRTPDKFYGDDKVLQVRYLVMERLDRDLIALSRNPGEVNSSLVAGIGLQILNGLEWIHQKGFLFIDVKPDNFMLKGADVFFVDCKLRYLLRRKQKVCCANENGYLDVSWVDRAPGCHSARPNAAPAPVRGYTHLLQRCSTPRRPTLRTRRPRGHGMTPTSSGMICARGRITPQSS